MLVGMLLFPDEAQLDFTGPHESLSRLPGVEIKLISSSSDPIVSSGKMKFIPDALLDDIRQTDVLFVPGGPGVDAIIEDRGARVPEAPGRWGPVSSLPSARSLFWALPVY